MFGLDTTVTTIEEPMFRVRKDDNLYFLEEDGQFINNRLLTKNWRERYEVFSFVYESPTRSAY